MLIVLIIIFLLVLLYLNISTNESFTNDGYVAACSELTTKRQFLYTYMSYLRNPVQDLSNSLINAREGKDENMAFQQAAKQICRRNLDSNCKGLASVDAGVFEVLPDVDLFYYNLLYKAPNLDNLLQELNYYSAMIGCDNVSMTGGAIEYPSNTHLNLSGQIGSIDVETLALDLEKLSPYYLSPEVVRYLLRFLISEEQLSNLNETVTEYLNQETKMVPKVLSYFPQTRESWFN